jgi:hypothetical protein
MCRTDNQKDLIRVPNVVNEITWCDIGVHGYRVSCGGAGLHRVEKEKDPEGSFSLLKAEGEYQMSSPAASTGPSPSFQPP